MDCHSPPSTPPPPSLSASWHSSSRRVALAHSNPCILAETLLNNKPKVVWTIAFRTHWPVISPPECCLEAHRQEGGHTLGRPFSYAPTLGPQPARDEAPPPWWACWGMGNSSLAAPVPCAVAAAGPIPSLWRRLFLAVCPSLQG